jgi:hypothetical protein
VSNPFVGVWELVSDDEEGMLILTERYFMDLTVRQNREFWPIPFDPTAVTDEMRAEAWKGLLFSVSGTYEVVGVEGSEYEVLFHPSINRIPLPNRDFTHKAKLEGDTMSGDIGPRHEVWRRVATG